MSFESQNKKQVFELLHKVNELAKRGVDGEKSAAELKLKQLLKKYGISYGDFVKGKSSVKDRKFKVTDWGNNKDMLIQCIYDVVDSPVIGGNESHKLVVVSLTDMQYIEVLDKFNHYWEDFNKESRALLTAYVVKNKIGMNSGSVKSDGGEVDKELIKRASELMNNVKENRFVGKNKMLNV